MLHRIENRAMNISGINKEWLKKSITLFKNKGFQFITLEQFRQHITTQTNFPDNALLVTIDDGYSDQVEEMVPIFLEQNVKPAVFLISDLIEHRVLPWDESIRYVAEHTKKPYIHFDHLGGKLHYYFDSRENKTWARRDFIARCELLPLAELTHSIKAFAKAAEVVIPSASGTGYKSASLRSITEYAKQGASFSSHTNSHLILASNDVGTCDESIKQASVFFDKNALDTSCFAYPIGKAHSILHKCDIPKQHNFDVAFTTIEGIATTHSPANAMPRISYPLDEHQLDSICSPLATYRYDKDNWLIKLHHLKTLKVLINRYGGKAAAITWLKHQLKLYTGQYKQFTHLNFKAVERTVFFCKGNINRSALAATVFKINSQLTCASFGLKTEVDFPPSIEVQRWARKHNIDIIHHKTSRVEDFEFCEGDLLIAFEPEQIEQIREPTSTLTNIQYTVLGVWAEQPWAYIHDPVARPEEYSNKCFSMIQSATQNLAKKLFPRQKQKDLRPR